MEDHRPEAANVTLLREYHAALQASDGAKMSSMLAPDLSYWISPGSAFSGTHTKESVLALLPAIFDAQDGPSVLTYHYLTAQDDRVSVVADSTVPLKAGGSYDQTYHWLFRFRDGLIIEILEYIDILQVWKTFGTPEQKAMAIAATADPARTNDAG
jgi:hypothetical protein